MTYHQSKRVVISIAAVSLFLVSTGAMAQDGVFGLISFFNKIFQDLQEFFGYLLALVGIISMGFGVFNIIQHFRVESRDDPNQKSRLVYGIVSFLLGIMLAGGAYQTIGSNTDFTESSGSILDIESVETMVQLDSAGGDIKHPIG